MNAARSRWALPSIVLLALAASFTGIVNQFTYDDKYIVEQNKAMHAIGQWWMTFASSYWPREWGGDGYRPITILAFQIEYALGGGSPVAFHAANILLYALACVLVYRLACAAMPDDGPAWAPWLVAALFAVHPVHVEAVANIVGQSELIVGSAVIAAVALYVRERRAGPLRLKTGAIIALLYAVACFAKEHGIVLPALLAAAEVTLIADPTPRWERVRRLRPYYLFLVLIATCFIAVRTIVLKDHGIGGFQPFTPFNSLQISNGDRALTALGVVPEWLRLLYWPARLSSEYGPPMIEIAQGPSLNQIPGLALLIGVIALGILIRRKRPMFAFGVAFVCISLAPSSNFVLPAGILLAERTLFLPSVGAMLIAGDLAMIGAEWIRQRYGTRRDISMAAAALCGLILLAGATKSALRSTVWRDNDTLFRQAVIDSPRAYRAHYMLGTWNFGQQRRRDGEALYRRALNLFPYDPYLSYDMAERYREVGLCDAAAPLYKWSFEINPEFPRGRASLAWCLLEVGKYDEAREWAFTAIRAGGTLAPMRRVIFIADSLTGRSRLPVGATSKVPETVQKTAHSSSDRGSTR